MRNAFLSHLWKPANHDDDMKPTIRFAAVIRLILAPIAAVRGATLYWSGDGISQGGVGTWNTSLARWSATPGGPFTAVWYNTAINSAVLEIQDNSSLPSAQRFYRVVSKPPYN